MKNGSFSEQIERILRSRSFATKGQLRKLLEVLAKNMESQNVLSPDFVIRELWPDEIRTKRSADVATEMNRLRHALDAYYDREGKTDPIRISLPNRSAPAADGTYEKRWIVAKPDDASDPTGGNHLPRLAANPRKDFKRIAIFAALVTALGFAAYASIRMLAVHAEPRFGLLDGSTLKIMDAEGKELWSKSFPDGFSTDWYYQKATGTRIWFGDLEGEGRTSVLFAYLASGPQAHGSTLICYSDRGKEKWRWTPGRELAELAGSPPTFRTVAAGVLKAGDKRPPRIVVASVHDPWWPSQIAILDSNGKTISEYWHSGALTFMTLADLDGDGREEIVATGVSEYDHRATLVVLDPERVFGASTEERPEFQIHGMGVAQERLRLLFPRSDLNKALFQYNQAIEPAFDHGVIRLTVRECTSPPGCPIWYEFDNTFRLISAYAGGDEFRSTHERFYETGKNAHLLGADEQKAFQKIRCLTGCKSDFVTVGKLVP